MITTAQLHHLAEREGLRFDQAEKDYVHPLASVGISPFRRERARLGLQGRDVPAALLL